MTRVLLRGRILHVVRDKQKKHSDATGNYLAIPRAVSQVFCDFFVISEKLAAAEKELAKFKKFKR